MRHDAAQQRDDSTSERHAGPGGSDAVCGAGDDRLDALKTGEGSITVAETVVVKVAGVAAREIGGVHSMGGGASRAFGALKQKMPGTSGPSVSSGVSVEVGETQAAIDLNLVVEYGVSIADLGRAVQKNVKESVEQMTGLEVTEVNVSVDDVYLGEASDDDAAVEEKAPRVQ